MAQLKDSVVQGSLRVTDKVYTGDILFSTSQSARYVMAAPTSAGIPTWRALTNADVNLGNVENTKLSTWTGSTNITTVGNITTGTWSATKVGVSHGGTGQTTLTSNAILAGNTTSAINTIATASGALFATGNNSAASFGTLPVAQGGTGQTTFTSKAILLGNGTSALSSKATAKGAMYVTAANGDINFATLPVSYGGTGQTTLSSGAALIGNGTSAIQTRSITNNTTKTSVTGTSNLITANTLFNYTGSTNVETVGAVTAGTWQASIIGTQYGGTGINSSSTDINKVFASPASGSAGAPTFRLLEEADIPDLSTDKITSGTFNTARIPTLDIPLAATYTTIPNSWQQFIVQTDNKIPFSGTVRLRTYNTSNTAINQQIDLHFISRSNTIIVYGWDSTRTTWSGNSGIYQIRGYATKEDGNNSTYTSYYGGLDLYINSTTARTIEVYALELKNCTVNSTLVATTYNSTYHNIVTYNTMNNKQWGPAINNADNATMSYGSSMPGNNRLNGSIIALTGYGLFGIDEEGHIQGLSIATPTTTSNTTNISTTRVYNTHGIDWTKGIYYSNNSSWRNANTTIVFTPASSYYVVDLRYSDNCINNNSSFSSLGLGWSSPVYLRGYIKEDNLFYLAPISVTYNNSTYQRAWTQAVPTQEETITVSNNNYPIVYIYLGYPYRDNAYDNYRLSLIEHNPVYWYKNGAFRQYSSLGTYVSPAGTWNGSTIDVAHGGTGTTSQTASRLIYTSSTAALSSTNITCDANTLTSPGDITVVKALGSEPKIGVKSTNTDAPLECHIKIGSGRENHGLISSGYNKYENSTNTYTANEKWMIYRNDAGAIIVNGHSTEDLALTGGTMTGQLIINTTETFDYFIVRQNGTNVSKISLTTIGTTTAEGLCTLHIGNTKTSTEDKNASGKIILYNKQGNKNEILAKYGSGTNSVFGSDHNYIYFSTNVEVESTLNAKTIMARPGNNTTEGGEIRLAAAPSASTYNAAIDVFYNTSTSVPSYRIRTGSTVRWSINLKTGAISDYAEQRKADSNQPGRVYKEQDNCILTLADKRLIPGCSIISDTYGSLISGADDTNVPIAVSGRVLVYPYQDRNNYHSGMAVCSAPNGTVDIMTREEIKEYPDCILGYVAGIPNEATWIHKDPKLDGRIWIRLA